MSKNNKTKPPINNGETPPEETAAEPPEAEEPRKDTAQEVEKKRKPTVGDFLVKEGLAEKKIYPKGGGKKAVLIIPSPLGAGLAGFNGWGLTQEITQKEFKAGIKALENKTAGSNVAQRMKGKEGK